MLATWLSTFFGEAVTSCLLCVWLPLCLGVDCRLNLFHFPEFSCSCCPTSTSCLATGQSAFIKQVQETNLYRVKSLSHSTPHPFLNKNSELNLPCLAFFLIIIQTTCNQHSKQRKTSIIHFWECGCSFLGYFLMIGG